MKSPISPIERAVECIGGAKCLADHLGITPSMVSQWITGRRPVAAKHVRKIVALCGGSVTCHELCPDVFEPIPAANDDTAPTEGDGPVEGAG